MNISIAVGSSHNGVTGENDLEKREYVERREWYSRLKEKHKKMLR